VSRSETRKLVNVVPDKENGDILGTWFEYAAVVMRAGWSPVRKSVRRARSLLSVLMTELGRWSAEGAPKLNDWDRVSPRPVPIAWGGVRVEGRDWVLRGLRPGGSVAFVRRPRRPLIF
jgi:hypothetical protein